MDAAIRLCAELESVAGSGGAVPSLSDVIIKAAAVALSEQPSANGSSKNDGLVLREQINVGVAVARLEAVVVPAALNAFTKSLGYIALRLVRWPHVCIAVRSRPRNFTMEPSSSPASIRQRSPRPSGQRRPGSSASVLVETR